MEEKLLRSDCPSAVSDVQAEGAGFSLVIRELWAPAQLRSAVLAAGRRMEQLCLWMCSNRRDGNPHKEPN